MYQFQKDVPKRIAPNIGFLPYEYNQGVRRFHLVAEDAAISVNQKDQNQLPYLTLVHP